jgi:UDP-glucose 4-epimerase
VSARVLVTGASGRIGRALCRVLETVDAFEVIPVVSPRVTVAGAFSLDMSNDAAVGELVREIRPDAIIHLAAATNAPSGSSNAADRRAALELNSASTGVIVDAASRAGVGRVVLASSAAVYGDRRHHPVDEFDELNPSSDYAQSKVDAEAHLVRANSTTVALRIFNVFGPGFDDSLVSRLRASSEPAPVTLRGLDSFVRDYVHVADVADAFVSSLRVPLADEHSTFNIGRGIPVSNRALVDELGLTRPIHVVVEPGAASYSCARIDRARRLLAFAPTRGLSVD